MNSTAEATQAVVLTNPKDGATITTPFANDCEAKKALRILIETGKAKASTFSTSLLGQSNLSAGQKFWLHKMAIGPVPVAPVETGLKMDGLKAMFDSARKHLPFPGIVLSTGDREIKLYVAGKGSKYPGQIMVVAPKHGTGYYGRVDDAGSFYPGYSLTTEVRDLVRAMSDNPIKTAQDYGRLTGRCCFCKRSLKDDNSTEVGYGKTCAEHYNLPWGKAVTAVRRRRRVIE